VLFALKSKANLLRVRISIACFHHISSICVALAACSDRILAQVPAGLDFTPLMTLYLTDQTSAAEIKKAHASGIVKAVKLYPAGATTNSDSGVTDIAKVAYALLLLTYCAGKQPVSFSIRLHRVYV
jgi:hypothetical protein